MSVKTLTNPAIKKITPKTDFNWTASPTSLSPETSTQSSGDVITLGAETTATSINYSTSIFDNTLDARGALTVKSITGGKGNDVIWGSNSASLLNGGQGNDSINGGGADDLIAGGIGDNNLSGGLGSDQFIVTGTDNITDFGLHSDNSVFGDNLYVGQDAVANANLASNFVATIATENNGTAKLSNNGFNIDLSAVELGDSGFILISNGLKGASLVGSSNKDTLSFTIKTDLVNGKDILAGGPGADNFLFNIDNYKTPSADQAYPTLSDFTSGSDKIRIKATDTTIFDTTGQLVTGSPRFFSGTNVADQDALNRIIYTPSTGILSFDADGNGPINPIVIAKLGTTTSPNLKATDIIIVGNASQGDISINGVAIQGQILTASNTFADVSNVGAIAYQWLADDAIIPGANNSSITLSEALVHKKISVSASFTDLYGIPENVTSLPTRTVSSITDIPSQTFVVATSKEDNNVKISFADLKGLARKIDTQDANSGFIITSINTGSLKIGPTFATAEDWSPINNIIDSKNLGYWTPDLNANRILDAFKVVGKDNPDIAIQTIISVNRVNDAPTLNAPSDIAYLDTPFDDTFDEYKGQLVANDVDKLALSFSIKGGKSIGTKITLSNSYGTLVLQKSSGNYNFTPNKNAIELLDSNKTVTFTVTVSDGIAAAVSKKLNIDIRQDPLKKTESKFNDNLSGTNNNDKFNALAGNDTIDGLDGNDTLQGGAGNDLLVGGLGTDFLTGGKGKDIFKFNSSVECRTENGRDSITDFTPKQGDKIDLSSIDADTLKDADQAFTFIGSAVFSGQSGELTFSAGILSGDTNGDKTADFEIELLGINTLGKDDIIL
ncbi:MAG: VCBS domain-containing protein [Methylococcales bacterium]|nr:VCBS domain-containing protein [Methylococcales bacterium]